MSIYTKSAGLAKGFHEAVLLGIQTIAEPANGLLLPLLHGDNKALIIDWKGSLNEETFQQAANPARGDGDTRMTRPGDPLFQMPVNIDSQQLNIRMGVPLWVLGWRDERPITLAMGLFHPVLSSASLDLYCPKTSHHLSRLYFIDEREIQEEEPSDYYLAWREYSESRDLEAWDVQLADQPTERAPQWQAQLPQKIHDGKNKNAAVNTLRR